MYLGWDYTVEQKELTFDHSTTNDGFRLNIFRNDD